VKQFTPLLKVKADARKSGSFSRVYVALFFMQFHDDHCNRSTVMLHMN